MFSIINMLVFYIIVVPISVFLHEMGHAFAALCLTKKVVLVYMGSDKQSKREILSLGRLKIHLTWGLFGSMSTKDDGEILLRNQIIGISLGGPLVSLFLAVAMLVVYLSFQLRPFFGNLVFAAAVFNFINLCVTLVPTVYSAGPYAGRSSDGYRILEALGKR
ncbi:hypothetical protein H1230_24760 [Paenibacillus sp. 19GGS1-52]|uniref:site-2 protease family protein n=1 Tax=Paenibacillus sp. 19GGS1-52 TaxID=2758563 RepID=UPI001EFABC1D|nr:site-2 protease family protein [Paenibacillus sp. 19GGS1-52]ULO06219.1 hypothetical protein H1230_24760 [Paenibacillus sp. 19GGS1-52]